MSEELRIRCKAMVDGRTVRLTPISELARTKAAGSAPVATVRMVTKEQADDLAEERRLDAICKSHGAEKGSFKEQMLRLQHDKRPPKQAPAVPPGSDLEKLYQTTRGGA